MRRISVPVTPDCSTLRGTIMHSARVVCLLGVSAVISGCSFGYYVDPVDYLDKRPAASERVVSVERSRTARQPEAQPVAAVPSGNSATTGAAATASTPARGDETKPWPKRGTPELEKLQAEEAERNRKIEQLLRTGVCRGC
jgi:hypothetical protein